MTIKLFLPALLGIAAISVISFTPFSTPKNEEAAKHTSAPSSQQAATRWSLDKSHSNVKFAVTHMVITETEGYFKLFDGYMEHTKEDYSDAKIQFSVDVSSINTDNEKRDKHLQSDDFFNAEKYPQMTFVSTSFTPAGGNKYKLAGTLTIREVAKPVTFDVTYGGSIKDKNGMRSGFKAKTTINRFDYGLKWDKATETGGLVVSKEVEVTVNVELKKG